MNIFGVEIERLLVNIRLHMKTCINYVLN